MNGSSCRHLFVKIRAGWAGDRAAAEADALAALGEGYLDRWELMPDGVAMHGMASLVQPVRGGRTGYLRY